jgi:glycosyltransferase involved in cell wall biosynthesis
MRVPETLPAPVAKTGSLLFLGTLDYIPNEDAVHFFANSILPLLLGSGREIECRIVGVKPPKSFEALAGRAGLTVVGPVREVAPEYARARLMVVPLRAGSGTRIKILEAFRFGVPVVSTTVGAAGLHVKDGVHLLIADTPEEFSAACLRLLEDDRLARMLAENAFEWLRANHSLDRARSVLHALFEPV